MKYFFLTCCPGSGSTIITQCLNIAPGVHATSECGIHFAVGEQRRPVISTLSKWSLEELAIALRVPEVDEDFRELLVEKVRNGHESFELADTILDQAGSDAQVFIEKDPINVARMIDIAREVPLRARFGKHKHGLEDRWGVIFLRRNPYACVNSILRKVEKHGWDVGLGWGPPDPLAYPGEPVLPRAIRMLCRSLDSLYLAKAAGVEVLEVEYEAFLRDPAGWLGSIFAWLGTPVPMEYLEKAPWGDAISADRGDGWKTELDDEQKKEIATALRGLKARWRRMEQPGMALGWSAEGSGVR